MYWSSVFHEMYSVTFLGREVVCLCACICITQAVPLVSRVGRLSPSLCWRTCWSSSLHSTDTLQADPVSVRCTGSARHKREKKQKHLFLNFTLYAWLKRKLPLIGERCEFFRWVPNNSPKIGWMFFWQVWKSRLTVTTPDLSGWNMHSAQTWPQLKSLRLIWDL